MCTSRSHGGTIYGNCSTTSVSRVGLDYLPRTNLVEASNNDESVMNIQRIREFVRTRLLSIMDIRWADIPDRPLDVFAFKTQLGTAGQLSFENATSPPMWII